MTHILLGKMVHMVPERTFVRFPAGDSERKATFYKRTQIFLKALFITQEHKTPNVHELVNG